MTELHDPNFLNSGMEHDIFPMWTAQIAGYTNIIIKFGKVSDQPTSLLQNQTSDKIKDFEVFI